MSNILDNMQDVTWTSPRGKTFVIKTLEGGYERKHIGEVKENPKTTRSSSVSTGSGGGKKSKTSHRSSSSTSQSTKRVQDSNDTFTDLGVGGRSVPLDCYFVGDDHAQKAKVFENALCETGKSTLQLTYDDEFTVNVIKYSKKYTLVANINVTIISVSFHQTSNTTYPRGKASKTKQVKKQAAEAKNAIAQNIADTVEAIDNPSRMEKFKASYSNMLDKVSEGLSTVNDASLNTIMKDIMGQNLSTNALTMTSQLGVLMYKAAAVANKAQNLGNSFALNSSFGSLMGGWGALVTSLIGLTSSSSPDSSLNREEIDNLLIADGTVSMGLISVGESLADAEFETRKEAVEAADNLVELEQEWTNHIEKESGKIENIEDVIIRDSSVNDIVNSAVNEVLENACKLKVEKTIILSEDTTTINLAYEYYPDDFEEDPDKTINHLITTNGFSDDEFFLLKRGREVKIYI